MDPELPVVPLPLTQRVSTRQWTTVDIVLATLMAAGAIAAVASGNDRPGPHDAAWNVLRYLLVVVACVALPYRRSYPKPVLAIVTAAVTAFVLVGSRGPMVLAVVLATFTVASQSPPKESLRAAVAVITAITVASVAVSGLAAIVAPLPILIGWLAGENSRTRRAYIAGVTAWAAERDRRREERSQRAVADERLRIARELHDVVAHTMSVVSVRSGVARLVLDAQPDEARKALEIIETTSRRALQEMRLLVGVLRDGETGSEYAPAPGLDDLPQLVEEVAAAGVTVTVAVEGTPRPLPPGVDVSVFRILQEALTNVVRHAGPAQVRLALQYRPDRIEIQVADDGAGRARVSRYPSYPNPEPAAAAVAAHTAAATAVDLARLPVTAALAPGGAAPTGGPPAGAPPGNATASGHGLVGMRERVALFGGTLAAGPTAAGFTVAAVIPTDDRALGRL